MKKVIASIMIFAVLLSASGCKQKTETASEITYCLPMNSQLNSLVSNLGETPFAKKLQEETGVKIKFIHPNSDEQFNLMLSSSELPDIIETDWATYNGGAEKSIADGYIIPLNDIIEKSAPNLKAYLDSHSDIDKLVKTNEGNYYVFPFIRGDESLLTSSGPILRKDWLEDLGLDEPETMDDWYNVLTAFKNEKGATMPLSFTSYANVFNWGIFTGAYGVTNSFYIGDDKKVKYGPIEDGYKEFLTEMSKWYKEGLLDSNFIGIDSKTLDSAILNGKTGATVGGLGGGIGKYLGATTDPKFNLCGVNYPVKNKGEKAKFSARQNPYPGYGAAISKQCKNIDLAVKVLDYCYSEKGNLLNNFGIEGESYDMINGEPVYTKLITNNPDGLAMANVMSKYIRANYKGAFVQDKRYMEQYSNLPQQQNALTKWLDTDAANHMLPILYYSSEDSTKLANIINTISTYQDEQMIKFIMGTLPISEFDNYVREIKNMGIDDALEIYQTALDSYNDK